MVSISIAGNAQPTTDAVVDFVGWEPRGRALASTVEDLVDAPAVSDPDAGEVGSAPARRTTPYVIVDKSLTRC